MSDKLELIWYENPTRPNSEKRATSNHKDRSQTKKQDPPKSTQAQTNRVKVAKR